MLQNKYSRYLALVLGAAVLLIIFVGIGIYRFGWKSNFAYQTSRIIPYPIAIVDWEPIFYSTYFDELRTLKHYWQSQQQDAKVSLPPFSDNEIESGLMEELVDRKIIQISARKKQVSVSPGEIEDEWQKFLKNPETQPEVNSFLNQKYGWTEEKFKAKVVAPFLLQEKLKRVLASDSGSDEVGAQARAEEVYQKINPDGKNFEELAATESDDKLSSNIGGDMGYMGQEQFEPQVAEEIFKLKIGQISKPLRSSEGYLILKVEDLLYNDYQQPMKAKLRQILIKTFDFDDWLAKQKQAIKVWRLIPLRIE